MVSKNAFGMPFGAGKNTFGLSSLSCRAKKAGAFTVQQKEGQGAAAPSVRQAQVVNSCIGASNLARSNTYRGQGKLEWHRPPASVDR